MTAPTLTCDRCESEVDPAKDPRCIQDGGQDVMCEACRERAFDRRNEQSLGLTDDALEQLRIAYRIKRGWGA